MNTRGKWQGMLTIARFNWPFYVAAMALSIASFAGLFLLTEVTLKIICGIVLAGSAYFLIGSLGISHLIYDRSDLYRWVWLERALQSRCPRYWPRPWLSPRAAATPPPRLLTAPSFGP